MPDLAQVDPYVPQSGWVVHADGGWLDTEIPIEAGQPVTLVATGSIQYRRPANIGPEHPTEVGPQGTYLFDDGEQNKPFPLPVGALGPAPAYCLIGRIGSGKPFFVGRQISFVAGESGSLQLGVNDYDLSDNSGHFLVQASKPDVVAPIAYEEPVSVYALPGKPLPDCSVVVFYIDGLRPDVVREMAAMGHIPNINRLFVAGGVSPSNAFTVFPSDTITSNGTMWTGCFSDRHGLKGQVRFSRRTLLSDSYLEPMGPNRSAQLLAPHGFDRVVQDTEKAAESAVQSVRGQENDGDYYDAQVTRAVPLYQYLREQGKDWATGILPVMTEVPPALWTRSMVRQLPYFQAQDSWKYIDDANAHYAIWRLIPRDSPVMIVWLPETDSFSHKLGRGQFGMTRRTIAQADEMIGHMVHEIESRGRFHKTYFILVSDHGHHGGRDAHIACFDLADDFIFKPRQIDAQGKCVGGGLGLSVRQHRYWNRHPEDGSREFVFVDSSSDGAARLYFPRGHFRSGRWTDELHPADLLAYKNLRTASLHRSGRFALRSDRGPRQRKSGTSHRSGADEAYGRFSSDRDGRLRLRGRPSPRQRTGGLGIQVHAGAQRRAD